MSQLVGMRDRWGAAWRKPGFRRALLLGALFGVLMAGMLPVFFKHLDARAGIVPPDPLLNAIPAMEVALPVFLVLYAAVVLGVVRLSFQPFAFVRMVHAYALLLALRMITMWTLTFEPPPGIIPLVDPVTAIFYPGAEPFLKDLFFSGHTATPLLFAFAVGPGAARRSLGVAAAVVGTLVLVQHVHYTVDVLCAPFFAWLAWKLSAFSLRTTGALKGPASEAV